MRVFVLLFNVRTDNEGIHTIQLGNRNLVLAFEEEDDATRYALLLEAQDFVTPTVEAMEQEEVEEFCVGAGYDFQLVPKGFIPQSDLDRWLIAPPEKNLEKLDWQADAQPQPEVGEPMAASNPDLDRIRRQLEGLL
ncbi:hypothetical protein DO97_18300 [Neosynechococcus sphagnicola sy1]|uniref:DUF3110 domain-containing protein n=1 Tax=Neosynechococcus sphagnicola sy1 TaxID=1497020 RepID=A0A098TMC6_9CYAN|nr:DUF3110 domain-containing protein [Neosynechococcus sphagnicola]KGF73470.1 hypothetical protein DO97_18300 [Neosynechococcus sphagnicola sy1]